MTEVPTNPHLADVISENGLVLGASDLPLEPGLRLAVVGNLQCGCTVADLGQIGHGVSDGDGSVNSAVSSGGRQTNKQSFLCSMSDSQLQVWSVSITVSRY